MLPQVLKIIFEMQCRNLNLGSPLRQRFAKVRAKSEAQESHFHAPRSVGECEGMNLHTPKWAPTLGVKVPIELKHKLWPKEGSGFKLARPLKVKNRPEFLAWRWHDTYHWKALNEGYNFASNLTSIGGLHTKLWASKVTRVSILGISGLTLGSPMGESRDKMTFGCWPHG
jgi:hypothetical protein